jgi:hypothetical protein
MKAWLIKWLYNSLDDCAKWKVWQGLDCPTLDEVLLEQGRQMEKLFGGTPTKHRRQQL